MLAILCLVVACAPSSSWTAEAFAGIVKPVRASSTSSSSSGLGVLQMSSPNQGSTGSSDVERLRDSATRLRKEAEELEAQMAKVRKSSTSTIADTSNIAATKSKAYTTLDDSEWTVSYRFASDPPPKDDEGSQPPPLRYYSGKVGIKFRADGYTDLIDTEQVKDIQYTKFWGWDEEISNEDNLRYILFSTDVVLPDSDTNAGSERFYFQARVEQDDRTGELKLADGKVSVKRDVEPPGRFWGVFNAGGILAQFRDCGDFVCRPR